MAGLGLCLSGCITGGGGNGVGGANGIGGGNGIGGVDGVGTPNPVPAAGGGRLNHGIGSGTRAAPTRRRAASVAPRPSRENPLGEVPAPPWERLSRFLTELNGSDAPDRQKEYIRGEILAGLARATQKNSGNPPENAVVEGYLEWGKETFESFRKGAAVPEPEGEAGDPIGNEPEAEGRSAPAGSANQEYANQEYSRSEITGGHRPDR